MTAAAPAPSLGNLSNYAATQEISRPLNSPDILPVSSQSPDLIRGLARGPMSSGYHLDIQKLNDTGAHPDSNGQIR